MNNTPLPLNFPPGYKCTLQSIIQGMMHFGILNLNESVAQNVYRLMGPQWRIMYNIPQEVRKELIQIDNIAGQNPIVIEDEPYIAIIVQKRITRTK